MAEPLQFKKVLESAANVEGRVPPQAVEIEAQVLGAMLLEREAIARVIEVLDEDAFHPEYHRKIFQAIIAMFDRSEPVDIITLAEELRRRGHLEVVGGETYLAELTMKVTSAANVEYHAKIVLEKSLLRNLIIAASAIAARGYSPTEDAFDLLDEAEQTIFQISEKRLKKTFIAMHKAVHDTLDILQSIHGKHSGVTGVPTGFRDFDTLTGGLQNSDLIIVAGRPSCGKTAFALSLARNAAMHREKPTGVGIFSLEMSTQQLVMRLLCAEAKVDAHAVRTGRLPEDDWKRMSIAAGRLADANIFIDDSASLGILELRAKARRLKAERNVGLIVVDYLQLMQGPKDAESREKEISAISRSLKALAKELNIPVVALSQLSRAVESRNDKRPILSDLRECVTGDTLVMLTTGERKPICELVGMQPEVFAVDEHQRIVRATSDWVWSVGEKPVYEMHLASGRTLKATAKHRVLSAKGWVHVEEMKSGDRVAIARRIAEPSKPSSWSEHRLGLLAHLMGDGSYLSGQPLRYTTSSEDNSAFVTEAAVQEFGVTVNRHPGKGNWHQLVLSGNGNRWHPEGVNKWLRELGVFDQHSFEKRVPLEIFRLDNASIALFLKHLWATDGTIFVRKEGSRGAPSVNLSTNSEGLARDTAGLLLRFEIVARIRRVEQDGYRPMFVVLISGTNDQRKFLKEIGAFGPRKEQAMHLASWLYSREANTNVDTLPNEVFDIVKKQMKSHGISQRKMAAMRGTTYGGTSHFKFAPSREVLSNYAELLHSEELHRIATSDLFWDEVIEIAGVGVEEVFDLTVPHYESWLADGIVSHNSGAIEQDADVVAFVHRPEMYMDPETRNTSEMAGMAEIIVGKQRNGPIDDVKLAFVHRYARFENLAPSGFDGGPPPEFEEETPF
jgi:replicative DNA helicase